jgi:predicted KAP-like P-loop ATPase
MTEMIPSLCREEQIKNLSIIGRRLYEATKDKKLDDDDFKNIISLNGGYGTGKTWFLKEFKNHIIKNDNPYIVMLNIWKDDFADDPLIPILHEIAKHKAFKEVKDKISILLSLFKGAGCLAKIGAKWAKFDIEAYIDDFIDFIDFLEREEIDISGLEDLSEKSAELLEIKNKVKGFFSQIKTIQHSVNQNLKQIDPEFFIKKKSLELIKKQLHATIKWKRKPFYILVDELDRCRPDYAVSTLERIKHIFNVPGLIFILGVDRKQLEHSVRHAFGQEWDFDNYYLRFAPLEISLENVLNQLCPKQLLDNDTYNKLEENLKDLEKVIKEIFTILCDKYAIKKNIR